MFFTKTVILLEWIRIFVADRQRNAFIYAPCVLIGLNLGVYGAGRVHRKQSGLHFPGGNLWHP